MIIKKRHFCGTKMLILKYKLSFQEIEFQNLNIIFECLDQILKS